MYDIFIVILITFIMALEQQATVYVHNTYYYWKKKKTIIDS